MSPVGLQHAVDVLGPVLRIEELMKALAGPIEGIDVGDADLVLLPQQPGREGYSVPVPLRFHSGSVDFEVVDGPTDEFEERIAAAVLEPDGRLPAVLLGPGSQIELDAVGHGIDLGGPGFCFLSGQNVTLHAAPHHRVRGDPSAGRADPDP